MWEESLICRFFKMQAINLYILEKKSRNEIKAHSDAVYGIR